MECSCHKTVVTRKLVLSTCRLTICLVVWDDRSQSDENGPSFLISLENLVGRIEMVIYRGRASGEARFIPMVGEPTARVPPVPMPETDALAHLKSDEATGELFTQWSLLKPKWHDEAELYEAVEGFYRVGEYAESVRRADRLARLVIEREGQESAQSATIFGMMAHLLYIQGYYELAERHIVRVLAIRERVLGPGHPDTARTISALGSVYEAQGRFKEAQELFSRAIAIQQHGRFDLATTLYKLGILDQRFAFYETAEQAFLTRSHDPRNDIPS
jgi:tetratricopeptide (TPR) repeat protein